MQKFVRGNLIVCSGTFTPPTGNSQPSSAVAILVYPDADTGQPASSEIPLTPDTNFVWSGTWDSLLATEGEVEWRIQASGSLQAAAQGKFYLQANGANTLGLDP
jgi:hypothetical protein